MHGLLWALTPGVQEDCLWSGWPYPSAHWSPLDTSHILFPRCSVASLLSCLRLSLRDTQRSGGVLPLARLPSPTGEEQLSLLVLMQSPREGGGREERELHQLLGTGQPTDPGSASPLVPGL